MQQQEAPDGQRYKCLGSGRARRVSCARRRDHAGGTLIGIWALATLDLNVARRFRLDQTQYGESWEGSSESHMDLKTLAASRIRKHPLLVRGLTAAARRVAPETVIVLDYPLDSRQRWNQERPHREIADLLAENRDQYRSTLEFFLTLSPHLLRIPAERTTASDSSEPCWINEWMPALDGVALYGLLVSNRPKIFMEVGSGNSTKFARKAISDHELETKIISIDPSPRAAIDAICDEVLRTPVEDIDPTIFDRLGAGDVLYVDSSHRVFMNSDVTMLFLDVIPRLRSGVLVEIHDVTLPYDYPADWTGRHYSEQYLLAAYMLARGTAFDTVLPNYFISYDAELSTVLAPLWAAPELEGVHTHGCSFWLRMR